jgi:hypothetical protein
MSLLLKEEITEQQLIDAGFVKGTQYWNLGQSAGCISINRQSREICVKYQSNGYKSIGNQCLPNILLEFFKRNWLVHD